VSEPGIDLPEVEAVIEGLVGDLGRFRSANQTLEDAANQIHAMLNEIAALNEQFTAVEPKILAAIELVSSLNLDALRSDLASTDQRIYRLISDLDVLRVAIAELRTTAIENEKQISRVLQISTEHQAQIRSSLSSHYHDLENADIQRQSELKSEMSRLEQDIRGLFNTLQKETSAAQARQLQSTIAVGMAVGALLVLLILLQ
jgi:predicted  nucleic acid-binding Zn-ribbon protein